MSPAPFRPRSISVVVWRADDNEEDYPGELLEVGAAHAPGGTLAPVLSLELKDANDGTAPLITMHLSREKAQQLFAYIAAWLHHPDSAA